MLTGAVAVGALVAVSASAQAADPYTFALVPKNTNNPFFDQALAGCKKAEAELKGAVKCLYIGPGEHGGGDEQAQIVGRPHHQEGRRHRGFRRPTRRRSPTR